MLSFSLLPQISARDERPGRQRDPVRLRVLPTGPGQPLPPDHRPQRPATDSIQFVTGWTAMLQKPWAKATGLRSDAG